MGKANLEELLKEIASAATDAMINLDRVPRNSRSGMAARKRRGEERLEGLKEEYRKEAQARSVGVVLTGPADRQAAFAALVEKSGEGISVSGSELYEKLADSFYGSIGPSQRFGTTQQALFNVAWREVLRDLGADPDTARPPEFSPRHVADRAAAVALARELAVGSGGQLPNQLFVSRRATDRALALCYKEGVMPVVVTGAAEDDVFVFGKGGGFFDLREEDAVDDAAVKRAFKEVARQMKKRG